MRRNILNTEQYQELQQMNREDLIDLILGIKPEYKKGKVYVDGRFPSSQFHFSLELPEYSRIDDFPELKAAIPQAVKIPGSGFVNVEIFGSRVIVTNTCGAFDRPVVEHLLANALNQLVDKHC